MTGFPFFVLRIYTVLPRMKKISRFARNDSVGRSFTRLCVIMAGFACGVPDDGFLFFVPRTCNVLPRMKKISRSARNDGAGHGYPGLHVLSIKKGDVK